MPADTAPPTDAATLADENALLRQELARLRDSDRVFRALLEHAPILISTKDLQGTVTLASRHFNVLDGFDPAAFVGKNVFELFPPAIAEQLWRNDQRAARERCAVREEESVYHADKSLHTYATVKFPLFDEAGHVTSTCAVSTDITDARDARTDSVTDELTGLKNRRYFNMRFGEEQKRAQRERSVLTLLLADVDHFKDYNEQYGRAPGDHVLGAVAQVMRATLARPGDLCFRLGGDIFACLFASSGADDSMALAERVRRGVFEAGIAHRANPPFGQVTLSLGLVFIAPNAALDQNDFYALAEAALHRAKAKGRNRISR